jgi:hypothetical protein
MNKNTWDKDYTGAPGLKTLSRQDKKKTSEKKESEG